MRDAAASSTRRPYSGGRLTAFRVGIVALVVLLTGGFTGASTASAGFSRSPGTLTVSGYDYFTDARGDVVAGDPDTNLVISFTASRPLDDGTLTIALPARDWQDPLQVGDRLSPYNSAIRGAVVVRPSLPYDEPTDADCRAAPGQALTVAVTNQIAVRTATVSHLTCEPTQSITLRVFDVHAPQRVGRTFLLAGVGDASGTAPTVLPLDVRPVPTTRLVLTPTQPTDVLTNQPVPFTVTAVDVRGRRERIDVDYRGTVNVVRLDVPCFVRSVPRVPVTFTAADQGQKTLNLSFTAPQTFRLQAYDVAKRALPGSTERFDVAPDPYYEPTTCSVSYH